MNQWIVVADASRARVFSIGENEAWVLERELEHPKSRAKASDLTTDAPGRVQQSFSGGHRPAMSDRTDPKEVEAEVFARELADFLEQGCNHNRFDRLVIVAPPHFLGVLRKTINGQVEKRVHLSIDKDYTQLSARDLPKHVTIDAH
jgi:protein required for attachment to host cells